MQALLSAVPALRELDVTIFPGSIRCPGVSSRGKQPRRSPTLAQVVQAGTAPRGTQELREAPLGPAGRGVEAGVPQRRGRMESCPAAWQPRGGAAGEPRRALPPRGFPLCVPVWPLQLGFTCTFTDTSAR